MSLEMVVYASEANMYKAGSKNKVTLLITPGPIMCDKCKTYHFSRQSPLFFNACGLAITSLLIPSVKRVLGCD
jgi:hypothetical protein